MRAFFALQIMTKSHLLTLRAQIEQGRLLLPSASSTNSVDPDQTAPMEQSDLGLLGLPVYLR